MKGRKGYEILKEIKTVSASMKVLVFTAIHKEEAIMYMLKYGASGYLVKDIHFGELAKALRAVHEKGQYIGVSAIDSLLHSTIDWQENHNAITEAEMRFLSFCCDDTVYKEIAGKTGVSPRTIEKYRDSLFKKLKIRTKTGLATFAMDMGFSPH